MIRIFLIFCLVIQALTVPVPQNSADFDCSGESSFIQNGKSATYRYETDTTLFINDISDEAKSNVKLSTNVVVSSLGSCSYLLQLKDSSVTGESMSDPASAQNQLNNFNAVFRLNAQGELDSTIKFQPGQEEWTKNVKRAIVSSFQTKAYSALREAEDTDAKSMVVYETDVLGRCRTTYRVEFADYQSSSSYTLNKNKSLQRCTLPTNQEGKLVGGQFVPYKQIPEFFDGRLFIEDYKCKSVIRDNLLNSVECTEVSTFKLGSRGIYGAQAIVHSSLNFKNEGSAASVDSSTYGTEKINFVYYNSKTANIETENFSPSSFITNVCNNALNSGLSNDHSTQFKDLSVTMKSWSVSELTNFYHESVSKCKLGGLTASQALLFTNTDNSVEAALVLVDEDAFKNQFYISEIPALTALARNPNPSHNLVNKLKEYIEGKSNDFAYYEKLSLVYSTLVWTHCKNNGCTDAQRATYSSVFARDLGTDCSSDKSVVALKSIGNIGFFNNAAVLEKCAQRKENTLETRVSAINSLRRFSCDNYEPLIGAYEILADKSDDSEVRINAFLSIMRCSDESKTFADAAKYKLPDFLLEEEDSQLISFVIDYGKEHGLTSILNAALNDPRIRAKFAVHFKELSWNNYKYMYNVLRDGAIEVETSVIYTPKTWIPRSIRHNVTLHGFGTSINMIEANLRLEGMDEILKGVLIDKLTSDALLKRVMEDPQQLIEILQTVAAKLKYQQESAKLTFSIKVYGNDVFYSHIDNKENFEKLANFVRNPRETILYKQMEAIKHIFVVDTQIRQPLMNGLSFNRYLDISAALMLNKKSAKENEDDGFSFNVDNFWSYSGSLNGIFEVALDEKNKLSLKKKAFANAQLKMDVDGYKRSGNWQYNLHLRPMTQIPLFTADGKFYKLGTNGYQEITEFKTIQHNYIKCNTDKFQETFGGIKLCLSANRPDFGSLIKILRDRRTADLEELFKAYYSDMENDLVDGEGNFANDNHKRPTLLLAGPYHYELTLKNPELIKSIVLDAKFDLSFEKSNIDLEVSTISSSGQKIARGVTNYQRFRKPTLRGIHGLIELTMKNVQTNDVRLHFLSEMVYHKGERFGVTLEFENKIIKPFHHKISFGRDNSNEDNVVPKYHFQVLIDSTRGPVRYSIDFDLTPNGRDISGNFVVVGKSDRTGQQEFKVFDGKLTLTSQSEYRHEYLVDIHGFNKLREANLDITGSVLLSMFQSKIDLLIDYKNRYIVFPKPAHLQFGHEFDGSSNGKSNIHAHVEHAYKSLDHGVKATFVFNVSTRKLSLLEIALSKPSLNKPVVIFFEKNISDDGKTRDSQVNFGLKDLEIDLEYSPLSSLIKVDFDKNLKTLAIHFKRVHVRGASIEHQVYGKKNGNDFLAIEDKIYGNRNAVKNSLSELPKTRFGLLFKMRYMDNSGEINTWLDIESSKQNNTHGIEFLFETKNLFRILSRVSKFESKLIKDNNDFTCAFEMKRLGEVRGYKVVSTSGLRNAGVGYVFDLSYEKSLANGRLLKGTGTGKIEGDNFKNWNFEVDIPDHYFSEIKVKNSRSNEQTGHFADHLFHYENRHLDFEPSAGRFDLRILNTTSTAGKFNFLIDARNGPVGALDNRNLLNGLASFSTANQLVYGRVKQTSNGLSMKLNRFNLDLETKFDFAFNPDGSIEMNTYTNLKVPAIITDPGKLNTLSHSLNIKRINHVTGTLKNRFETDSKLFGKFFRVLNIDHERQLNQNTDMINAKLNIEYRLRKNPEDSELKTFNFKIAHDMHKKTFLQALQKGYKVNVEMKQNRFETYRSFITGETLKITDCTYNEVLLRDKSNSRYLLNLNLNVACNGKLITNTLLNVDRKYDAYNLPSTRFELSTKSDNYGKRHVKAAHDKFSKTHGLVSISYNDGLNDFANELSYDRKIDAVTSEMKDAHYHLDTSFGENLRKICDLNFARGADFYSSLNCRLNTTKVPDIELAYGYRLQSTNVEDRLYGKRNGELDIFIPGRTMRVTYNANLPSYFDGNDDDEDRNNEREFNATSTWYWNYVKEPTKFITVKAKRDNFALGKSTTFIELLDTPHFKVLTFKVDKTRTFNLTNLVASAAYELKTGSSNSITLDGKLSSDMDISKLSLETIIEKPSFNTLYENHFNKKNGRLQYLGIRVGKVLRLSVDKNDPENRLISFQLTNPNKSEYQLESTSSLVNEVYTVESTLKKAGSKVSSVLSKFDAKNTHFNAVLDATQAGKSYTFNFGVFDETLANAVVKQGNEILGKTSLQVVKNTDGVNELVMSMKWNRFWREVQANLLNGNNDGLVEENPDFNSYLGDVYGQFTNDLKPVVVAHRKLREQIHNDFQSLMAVLLDFYSNALAPHKKAAFNRMQMQYAAAQMEAQLNKGEELPVYKKFLRKYNEIAKSLSNLSIKLRKVSKKLSTMVPRLPTYEYNQVSNSYANNLVIRRPTLHSKNLYQFNHEYRNYVLGRGNRFLALKRNLVRPNIGGMSLKALYNKYKYRSLKDYTLVAHVFNKRNIIGWDSESTVLQTRCRYLLAHETHKNRFSVVLNFDKTDYPITVHAYGKSVDLGYDRAAIEGTPISIPKIIDLEDDRGTLTVSLVHQGVTVELNHDLKVTCYTDSKSCTIATTRWFTGKLDGLLGKADSNQQTINQQDWFLNRSNGETCSFRNAKTRLPTEMAVKTCYKLFGRHKHAVFRDAIQAIKPEGFNEICKSVLTASLKYKCAVMRAFVHHAKEEKIEVNAADECFSCSIKNNAYGIGQSVARNAATLTSNFAAGTDMVVISLPCKSGQKPSGEFKTVIKNFISNGENRMYYVKVGSDSASIYKSATGQTYNSESAHEAFMHEKTSEVSKKAFKKGMMLAGSLLTQRLAQHRIIVIKGCGNCPPYAYNSQFIIKKLKERNIKIISVDEHNIKDLDDLGDGTVVYGYDNNRVHYMTEDGDFDHEPRDDFKIDHRLDLCARLAVKTGGYVIDSSNPKTDLESLKLVLKNRPAASYKVGTCQKLNTPIGDFTDFSFTKTEVKYEEDYDY